MGGEDMTDSGTVRITPREVYDRVLGMEKNVSDMVGLLERQVALQEQRDRTVDSRLEEHSGQIGGHDTRLGVVEIDVRLLKEQAATREKRRAPWPAIVGAVAAIIAATGGLVALLSTLNQLADALSPHLP
jgi:hypothetical protein